MGRPKKRRGRRARGTGGIFFHAKRGVWVARLRTGGHSREVSAPTQAEVVAKLATLRPPGPATTLSEWSARWLDGLGVRRSTHGDYRASFRVHVNPLLGGVRVTDLTPHQIERSVVAWGKANTARKVLSHLRICLGAAVRAGLRADNPAALARKPRGERKKITPFTPAELKAIVRAATGRGGVARLIALLAATGCRLGEAIALDVSDWNPATAEVSITRTYSRRYGVRPPKSPHSVRTVRVPHHAHRAVRDAVGKRKTGPLVKGEESTRVAESGLQRAWAKVLTELGLPYRKLHTLRHSYASALIAAGDGPADVAKYLGDTVMTIVQTYLHPTSKDPSRTMERLFGVYEA